MYYLCKESNQWCIRYWENGKNRRLPISKYKGIRQDESELQRFITRLNHRISTKKVVEFKHAFINQNLLDEYLAHLCQQIPNQENAKTEHYYLVNYCINFYMGRKNVINPLDWPSYQDVWGAYLQSPECPKSAKTKRAIVQALNRFCLWLQHKRPLEITRQLVFNPISKARYKMIEATRELNGDKIPAKDISADHWHDIQGGIHSDLWPISMIAYLYGLRRSEILGLKIDDVKTDCLSIERQVLTVDPITYGPLKGRKQRFVPHWFCNADACYAMVRRLILMHPDTLTNKWSDLMKSLNYSYHFHDIRHTWTTNCWSIPGLLPKQIQDAAGHENIETTMKYTHSDKTLGKTIFKP